MAMSEWDDGARKANCWEVARCGRGPGEAYTATDGLGVCPAAVDQTRHGVNGGEQAGRVCWSVAGTLCQGTVQGSAAQKQVTCLDCLFFRRVKAEEKAAFHLFPGMMVS